MKRAAGAGEPETKRAAAPRAWNTLDGIINVSCHPWSTEANSALAPVWKHRLRWYETLLLLANRLNQEHPGIKDVFLAVLIPRFIKPRLLLNARFFSGVVQQYDRYLFPLCGLTGAVLETFLRSPIFAIITGIERETMAKNRAAILRVVDSILRSVEIWTDDPDPFDVSVIVQECRTKEKRLSDAADSIIFVRG